MNFVLAELAQQVVNLLCLRHEIRRPDERLPPEGTALLQVGQQVLDVQYAAHVVAIVLINGNTRVIVLYDTFQHLVVTASEIQVNHILTRRHNLLGRVVAKAYYALEHALFFLYVLLVGQFQSLLQIAGAERAGFLLHHLSCQKTCA